MGVPDPGVIMGTRIYTEPGYIVVAYDGQKSHLAIADVLRAADIPLITYEQVRALKAHANMFAVLVRTLIDKGVLDNTFLEEGEFDLLSIMDAIEDMGGDYELPDLSVDQ